MPALSSAYASLLARKDDPSFRTQVYALLRHFPNCHEWSVANKYIGFPF